METLSVTNSIATKEPFFRYYDNLPVIVGHRGFFYQVENSLLAFKTAIDFGIKIVELDIWLTKDDIPVVIHCNSETDSISETSNGKGKVSDFLLSEIKEFSLDKGEKIPTLREVFELCQNKVKIIVEIKEKVKKTRIIEELMKLIREFSIEDSVIVSSFDHSYYSLLREKSYNIEFKFNINEISDVDPLLKRNDNECFNTSVCCNSDILNKTDVEKFHCKNQPVSVYFYPDNSHSDERIRKLCGLQIDHFIVDEPHLVTKQINEIIAKN